MRGTERNKRIWGLAVSILVLLFAVVTPAAAAGPIGFEGTTEDITYENGDYWLTISGIGIAGQKYWVKWKLNWGTAGWDIVNLGAFEDTGEVYISGGCFQMGNLWSTAEMDVDLPVHQVCLSPYYIDVREVTQSEFGGVMGTNPSDSECGSGNCPVYNVTWSEARDYCTAVGKRLPSEAEWEYAARNGGQEERWAGTNNISQLGEYAFYYDNSGREIQPVAQKLPNGLGIYDMSGNIEEWVSDYWDSEYYGMSPVNDPQGPVIGNESNERVLRGGNYDYWEDGVTTVHRDRDPENSRGGHGFRCARTP